jgi:oligoendopeptidase F
LRRNAYRSFVAGLSTGKNTIAALFATQARGRAIEAKLRGSASATEMLLARQGVPLDLHNRLHDVILNELAPAMRRLAGLRQRQLGLTEVLYCDLEAQLDSEPGPVMSFAEGRRIICNGLSVLGPEYSAIIEAAFRDRWIDWADNEGKTSDSFAGGGTVPHPYVLINWDDSLRGVNTLAHELGHAAHDYLIGTYNPRGQACYPLLLCEAASTANEVIIGTQLLRGATEVHERRCIIEQLLTSYYHNLVRHLMEGELQRRLYPLADAGQPITADLLCRTQEDILRAFWGDSLTIDEGARLTWMRQSHYYMDTLYSYTYSGGISVGTAVARAILREGAAAAERWLTALKAGATLKPIELAALAGVDLTSPAPLRETVAFVGELVDELIATYEA